MENRTALQTAVEGISQGWGPLSSQLIEACAGHLETLLKASPSEDWLAALHCEAPANRELYRDPAHGFVLLAHTEQAGLYRPPHDHGSSWVVYAVVQGEIEMGTYGWITDGEGRGQLVKRGSSVLRAGQVQAYLPGDIHDTRCLTSSALLFRFTERDLKADHGRPVTRYAQTDGAWTPGRAA